MHQLETGAVLKISRGEIAMNFIAIFFAMCNSYDDMNNNLDKCR